MAVLACAGVLLPLAYLLIRAFQADLDALGDLLWRDDRLQRNLALLSNTLVLTLSVWVVVSLLAFPAAWLTGRCHFRGRRVLSVLLVLPLAVPSYLMAFTLLALGGQYGSSARVLGWEAPRVRGFWGALIALSVYLFPYLYLNLRASIQRLDPSLEETARALGTRPTGIFLRVMLPQLVPGFLAGGLLVVLHVIGDLGVVYFMQYETLSFVLYQQYGSFDMTYGACLALALMSLSGGMIALEVLVVRRFRLQRAGTGQQRRVTATSPGWWSLPLLLVLAVFLFLGVVTPVGTMLYWWTQPPLSTMPVEVGPALWNSVRVSLPAAVAATAIAMPIGFLVARYPSRLSRLLDRAAYIGYATPPLAFALGLVFFAIRIAPQLRDTIWLLVYAYTLHFLAESLGPVRSAVLVARERLEEVSRSLGCRPLQTFLRVTFPLIRGGVFVGLILVFLSAMKELPMTAILQPFDFSTLAYNVWDATNEGDYAAAAPHALTIVLFSSLFVGLILLRVREAD